MGFAAFAEKATATARMLAKNPRRKMGVKVIIVLPRQSGSRPSRAVWVGCANSTRNGRGCQAWAPISASAKVSRLKHEASTSADPSPIHGPFVPLLDRKGQRYSVDYERTVNNPRSDPDRLRTGMA